MELDKWTGMGCFAFIRKDPIDFSQFLIVKHAYGSKKWSLPGGGIKFKGEPADKAARREGKEETGYDSAVLRMMALLSLEEKADGGTVAFFDCCIIGGENHPEDQNEISDCKFVTFDEAAAMFKQGILYETQFKLIYLADNCQYGTPGIQYEWPKIPEKYYPDPKNTASTTEKQPT